MTDTELMQLARDELEQYKDLKKDIDHSVERLEELRTKLNRLSKPLDPNYIQVQHSNNNGTEALFDSIFEVERIIDGDVIEAEKVCMDLDKRISKITPKLYARILRQYFIFGKRVEDIAYSENYSRRMLYYYLDEALLEYGKQYCI